MMNICRINVITVNGNVYEETRYGVTETVERVAKIQNCDNVLGIEVIDMDTGEILYTENPFIEPYVSPAFVIELVNEVLS